MTVGALTPQESIWAGSFGDAYVDRNQKPEHLAWKIASFSKMLSKCDGVSSVLELGANIGLNMLAIRQLMPHAQLSAVEINAKAYATLAAISDVKAHHGSLFNFRPERAADIAFTMGVLIHLSPDRIADAYETLYQSSRRYILVAEYYNPTPVEVPYRGQTESLFKRDWAGEIMGRYPDLKLVDYGFQYHRDPMFPMDDMTWFLMEKR